MNAYKYLVRSLKYKIFKILPPNSVILDIGTGFGGDFNKYAEMNVRKIIAIEPSPENYEEMMRRYETGKVVGKYPFSLEGNRIPMEQYESKEPYDVVVAMLSMNFFFGNSTSLTQSFLFNQTFKFIYLFIYGFKSFTKINEQW